MSQDFLDDERRRLAYADRSPTLERKEATLDRRHEIKRAKQRDERRAGR